MPNDLVTVKNWIEAHGSDAASTVTAGLQLVGALTKNHPDTKPQEILTGIPDADLALHQAAGVAQIAGVHGVDAADVIEFASLLLSLGLTFIV